MEASELACEGHYGQFGQEKKASGDHFVVEDLLDFSNEEEVANGGDDGGLEAAKVAATEKSTASSSVTAVDTCSSGDGDIGLAGGELCEPYDDLAELEWLSNFVEDSFSSDDLRKLQLISGIKSDSGLSSVSGLGSISSSSSETRSSEIPSKARSKRSRPAPNNWSSRLLVLTTNTTMSSSDSDSILLNLNPTKKIKAPKPAKKKEPGSGIMVSSDGRRCLHCATDKTPQWRTGPMGPKTLCNACGVRYKSGRLVPEYRPAASPTFVLAKHSNSHRKVLELRRQKEMDMVNGDEYLIHHNLGVDFRQLI